MSDVQSRIAALSPEQRAVLESRLAELAAERESPDGAPIPVRDPGRPVPLSFAQQREWALERYRPSNNIPAALRLEGDLDLDLLSRSLTEVMARHEALRTTVELIDGSPVQVVNPVTPVPVPVVDLTDLDTEKQSVRVREFCDGEVMRPFPPEEPHRMRVTVLRLAADTHVAVLTTHHSSSDGWSMSIIAQETVAAYRALHAGEAGGSLPPPPIQYGDFAVWQRERLGDETLAAELSYWKETLADIPPRLALPSDRPSPARRTYAGTYHAMSVPPETSEALERFGDTEGLSTSMLMLAACSILLHRYTGQDDLVFGSAISGRTRSELEQVVGCFANALPLRMRLSRSQTVGEVLSQAREVASGAFDHQNLPFDSLIEELARDETSQTPLIQMMINVPTAPKSLVLSMEQALEMPGLQVRAEPIDPGPLPIDLILIVTADRGVLRVVWHYSTELFDHDTVLRLAEQLRCVLEQLVGDPDRRVGDLRLVDTAVPHTTTPTARQRDEVGFVELFRRQVASTPDAAAVVCDESATSFAELHEQARRVAARLHGMGVGADTPVGVLVDRSPRLPAAILGVLESGGAFLPLDPTYPADRVALMLSDAAAPVLVTTEDLAPLAAGSTARAVLLDQVLDDTTGELPDVVPELSSAAYVIYTSGSTGTPKGVVVEHRSLARFARDVTDRLQLGAGDRFLQFASPGFDVLVEELFPIWLAGGAVVMPPTQNTSAMNGAGTDLVELAEREHITVMELPAAYWHEWVRDLDRTRRSLPDPLRLVVVGAERVLPERLAMWQKHQVPLMHVYGITETTVSSTFYHHGPGMPETDLHLPIGTALPSVDLRVLDTDLTPVPVGAFGELYLGGPSLARGYLGRPAQTAERFVADPAHPGQRLYRSGDLVRQRADGNLEFLSRADDQITIRGYRVEPAEIESATCRHPQVAQAVVSVYEPAAGDRRLVAYLVPQPRTRISTTDLRRFLGRELPPYLVPSAYVQLDTMPVTDNGKIDHDRLPAPSDDRPDLDEQLVLPQTPLERTLADIVAGVLGITLVGANDNFFELGGDSILAIQVVARAQEQGITLQPLDLFENPTVTLLAAKATTATTSERVVTPRPPDAEPVLSFDQERLWLEDQLVPGAAYNVGGQQRLVGPLDVARLEASIRSILSRHESLRTRFPVVDGGPTQVVDDLPDDWHLDVVDLSGVEDPGAEARRLLDGESATNFDLANGPLFRSMLIRLSDTEHLLSITTHHIVADISSMTLLARELGALYEADGDASSAAVPDLPVQYRDFATWQHEYLTGGELERQVGYWRRHLAGAPSALMLPAAPVVNEGAGGGRVRSRLSEEETAALNELCRDQNVTQFMVVLASFATVLGRWSGQSDVVSGVSMSNRTDAGTENLIGCFINTLPLRVDMSGEPTFAELLARVREVALGGYAHADAPLDMIVKELQDTRDPRRTPLFQVMLNVIDSEGVQRLGDVSLEPVDTPPLPSSFDLVLTTTEREGSLFYVLEYDATRYDGELMQHLAEHFGRFLRTAVADPAKGIFDHSFQSGPEVTTAGVMPGEQPAPHLAVERAAAEHPGRVAVVDTGGEHTYGWVHQATVQVAETLTRRGVGRTDHLGVVRRPTAGFVAAVLGCLRVGAELSVLDPTDTTHRPEVTAVLDVSPNGTTYEVETVDLSPALVGLGDTPPTDRAVAADQRRDWAVERFTLTDADRVAVLSGSSRHLRSALSSAFHAGAAVVLPEHPPTRNLGALTTWLATTAVTVVYTIPPILRALTRKPQTQLPALRYAFVENTGELISRDVDALRRLAPACSCVAVYRTGDDGTPLAVYPVPDDWRLDTAQFRVPLGTEVATPAQLRHPSGQPAAVGEVAEICFGAHHTGDLGRRMPDGSLEFVGRRGEDPSPRKLQETA